ncbi:UNVERIFIED_CONTAM: hypothetical protein GTU68_046344 [Idotea baltica]|nr:hypothetical protein [Idotea baltica]
MCASPAGA